VTDIRNGPAVCFLWNRAKFPMLFIVRRTQQYDVKLSCIQLTKLHVSARWGHLQAYKI